MQGVLLGYISKANKYSKTILTNSNNWVQILSSVLYSFIISSQTNQVLFPYFKTANMTISCL